MNIAEIVAELRAKSPEVVEGLTDTAVKKLITAALGVVRDGVAQAEPGRLIVSGLGRFTIKAPAKDKGEPGDAPAKRKVGFAPAEAKAMDAEARAAKKVARKSAKKADVKAD